MSAPEEASAIAYCGLSCAICTHAATGCAGCHCGGGEETCEQRRCNRERGLTGCWECADFPCAKGFFGDEAWRGLNVGCCQVIRERGPAAFAELARAKLGTRFDYGELRFRTPEEVIALLTSADPA